MKKVRASLATVVLAVGVTLPAPAARADYAPPDCDVVGDAYCQPATCEDDAVVYRAKISLLERRVERAERRIKHKNATIKRLRKELRSR